MTGKTKDWVIIGLALTLAVVWTDHQRMLQNNSRTAATSSGDPWVDLLNNALRGSV